MSDIDEPAEPQRLLSILELERLDRDLFRAYNPAHRPQGRVFGGQVASQALRAASATVEAEHRPHSLHGYFLRPGQPGIPIILSVDRIRDGRSFTTRRVVAQQQGEAIFSLSASFHCDEEGGQYQVPRADDVPEPDAATGRLDNPFRRFGAMSPFEVRELGPTPPDERGLYRSTRRVWVRTRHPLPDDPDLHACVITYMSDMGVVFAARIPVGAPWEGGMAASLDHSVWFHRPVRADGWLLMDLRPVSNSGARGLVQGTIHTHDGVLAASIAQEALVRTPP